MTLHVALHEPLIPQNTGNIARTCAGTGTALHLIHPLGFQLEDKYLKRAGLDYWEHVDLREHSSIEELLALYPNGQFYYVTKFADRPHSSFDFSNQACDHFFVFGKETTGLPKELVAANRERSIRIPMNSAIRSLNLSNTAAILVYEALRQQQYPGLM